MPEEKERENKQKKPEYQEKQHINPSDIKGKIEIPDTRERRDGPGGN